jgi:hypothetical protein
MCQNTFSYHPFYDISFKSQAEHYALFNTLTTNIHDVTSTAYTHCNTHGRNYLCLIGNMRYYLIFVYKCCH